jgi:hypothetical protein
MESIVIESTAPGLDAHARKAIIEADVVIGLDVRTQCEFTVYGTPPLESTATMKRPAAMRTVRLQFDGSTQPLAELIALVHAIKRRAGLEGTS